MVYLLIHFLIYLLRHGAGSSEAAAAADVALAPLLVEGFPGLLGEVLGTLGALRCAGSAVEAPWEALALELLACLLAASPGAQAQLRAGAKDGGGMPVGCENRQQRILLDINSCQTTLASQSCVVNATKRGDVAL